MSRHCTATVEIRVRLRVIDSDSRMLSLSCFSSALVTDGLGANDQLFLDASSGAAHNDDLSEEKQLWHYQIKPDSVLLVKREDFTTSYCYYICADCGNDVKLKQRDAVRCRECGHRIVFKRRIAKPCQYLCR